MILLTLLSQCAQRHHQNQIFDQAEIENQNNQLVRLARASKLAFNALYIFVIMLICYAPYGIISPFFRKSPNPSPSLALGMSVSISVSLCNSCINPLVYCWKIRAVRVRAINLLTHILPGWNTRKQIQKEEYSKYFVTRYLNKRTHCEALVLNNWKEKL